MKWLNKKIIGGRNCLKCVCGLFSEDDTADADHLQTQLKNILTQVKVCEVRSLSFVLFFICFFSRRFDLFDFLSKYVDRSELICDKLTI